MTITLAMLRTRSHDREPTSQPAATVLLAGGCVELGAYLRGVADLDALAEMSAPAGTGLPEPGTVAAPLLGQVAFLIPTQGGQVTVRFDSPFGLGQRWKLVGPASGQPAMQPIRTGCPFTSPPIRTEHPDDQGTPAARETPAISGPAITEGDPIASFS